MNLTDLYLRSFRNYEEQSFVFDPGVNLIVGDNAQGKTNLLEAIAFLGSGKSFRALKNSELIRFGADFAELQGTACAQERCQTLRWTKASLLSVSFGFRVTITNGAPCVCAVWTSITSRGMLPLMKNL